MNKILKSALALAAASICVPAMAFTVYPDIDFEWHANVGKGVARNEVFPAARAGFIWSPGHSERGRGWVPGRWIEDTFHQQVAIYGGIPESTDTLKVYRADGSLVLTAPLPATTAVR